MEQVRHTAVLGLELTSLPLGRAAVGQRGCAGAASSAECKGTLLGAGAQRCTGAGCWYSA